MLAWAQVQTDLAMTAITVGELLQGVAALPHGRRRDALAGGIDRLLADAAGYVLPYDERAAHEYGVLRSESRRAGRGLTTEDGMLAAIVRAHGATLATRNVRDFAGFGFSVINPWDAA